MFKRILYLLVILFQLPLVSRANEGIKSSLAAAKQVSTIGGILQGASAANGVLAFKGIPYAAPPVGNLRWKAPQPAHQWKGVRDASHFGPRPMQNSNLLYEFRSTEMSEDCLYLNVWTPAKSANEKRAVYIFIHGGSFIRGDGSQVAYDGESMARQGIVYVSINYRLGVFGFLSHPELSKESGYNGSGNYGLLDQLAAIKWVKENIAQFGGDPEQITIGGESVGAQSVNAHLVSPLSQGLFSGAVAESGSLLDVRQLVLSLDASEKMGTELSALAKAPTIDQLRALPAGKLLKIVGKGNPRRFKPVIDHYFLLEDPQITIDHGQQAKVPFLTGWNAQEVPAAALFRLRKINDKNYRSALKKLYGTRADEVLSLYASGNADQVRRSSSELMSDRLINYSGWKLARAQATTSDAPVFLYLFSQPHPGLNKRTIREGNFFQVILKKLINKMIAGTSFHASEIEYALGNLDVQDNYAWREDDYKVSKQFQTYLVNFIKSGNPNGSALPNSPLLTWPAYSSKGNYQYMDIKTDSKVVTERDNNRYIFFQSLAGDKSMSR